MKEKQSILSLDISSTCTGWSLIVNGRFRVSKNTYGTIEPNKKLTLSEKLVFFREELIKVLNKTKPSVVAIENVYIRHKSSVVLLSRFSGVAIETIKEVSLIEPMLIETTKCRSILGIKNSKEDSFKYVVEKYRLNNFTFLSHNDITDSIVVGLAARKLLLGG